MPQVALGFRLLYVELAFLMTPSNHRQGSRVLRGATRTFYEMPFEGRYIWGVTAGIIRDSDGTLLGTHDGIDRFTIGQRKGLGVAAGKRRFVLNIVPETNEVIVGDPEELLASGLSATAINWLIDPPTKDPLNCLAKIRYRTAATAATVQASADGGAIVRFAEPQSAISPGQAVTFYDNNRVLGGGWIEAAERPT